jgi:hypothetical protein
VIFKQDKVLIEAEGLVREAIRIRTKLDGFQHHTVGVSSFLLAGILKAQNDFGGDTMDLLERSLSIFIWSCVEIYFYLFLLFVSHW